MSTVVRVVDIFYAMLRNDVLEKGVSKGLKRFSRLIFMHKHGYTRVSFIRVSIILLTRNKGSARR